MSRPAVVSYDRGTWQRIMNTVEKISLGMEMEVKQESVDALQKFCSENGYEVSTRGALALLEQDAVVEGLSLDCRMYMGKVAMYLPQ